MATALVPSVIDFGSGTQNEANDEAIYDQNILFFPGMYCPSGFDIMKIMYYIATRPNPTIDLGPVDASCPIVLCDLFLPDTPVVYASDSFLALTGYSTEEVIGRNCRFLQRPPPPPVLLNRDDLEAWQNESWKTPSPYVPPRVRQALRQSVAQNREVQVEVANFRKDGTPFDNVLSLVPIYWDDDHGGDGSSAADLSGSDPYYNTGGRGGRSRQSSSRSPTERGRGERNRRQRRYRYSVGFICDKNTVE